MVVFSLNSGGESRIGGSLCQLVLRNVMVHQIGLGSSRNRLTLQLVPGCLACACKASEDVYADLHRFCSQHLTSSQVCCGELDASSPSLSLSELGRNV